jgi:hypothetical protein
MERKTQPFGYVEQSDSSDFKDPDHEGEKTILAFFHLEGGAQMCSKSCDVKGERLGGQNSRRGCLPTWGQTNFMIPLGN